MPKGFETIAILIAIFIIIILTGLIASIILWVKSKNKAFGWFIAQITFLTIAFFNAIGSMLKNFDASKAMINEDIYTVLEKSGVFWAFSMLCMFIGIFTLYSEISRLKNPCREKKEYLPNIKKSIGLLMFYELLAQLVLSLILLMASRIMNINIQDSLLMSALTIVGLILTVKMLRRKYTVDIKSMFSMKKVKAIYFIPITISMAGLHILVAEISNFTTRLIPINDFWKNAFNAALGDASVWKVLISIAVVAPIVEEVLFRGLILKGYLKHYSVRKSLIISSLLFGIAHFNPWQFVTAVIIGVAIGWFYERTDSLVPAVYAHALNNSMAVIFAIIGISIPGYNVDNSALWHQPIWFDLLGVVLAVAGILWLKKLFGRKEEADVVNNSMNVAGEVEVE
jgi:membrane protease YdiL (CAAX protease family)